jgi:hypothetical protein
MVKHKKSLCPASMSPNKSLQRSGTHKVLGRGRPITETAHGHWRARVLKGQRAVAELGR